MTAIAVILGALIAGFIQLELLDAPDIVWFLLWIPISGALYLVLGRLRGGSENGDG
ncbi:MAG TPA: hypothetical protein VFY45_08650 [Baekduia sp.]|nr:hypothetical protein [Baekduia sp.]